MCTYEKAFKAEVSSLSLVEVHTYQQTCAYTYALDKRPGAPVIARAISLIYLYLTKIVQIDSLTGG